jgi:hypothetical protein
MNMYLGTLYIYTKFQPDQISNMAVRPCGQLVKVRNKITKLTYIVIIIVTWKVGKATKCNYS